MDFLSWFNLPFLDVVIDIALLVIRILLPILAVIIVFQCFSSMRRHRRDEQALIMLVNQATGESTPVLYWENSIGRSKGSDIFIADPTVSRDHAVLLRRKEGWFINDVGSKSGTYVNDKQTQDRTPIMIDDVIRVGDTSYIVKRTDDVIADNKSWFFNRPKSKAAIKPVFLLV